MVWFPTTHHTPISRGGASSIPAISRTRPASAGYGLALGGGALRGLAHVGVLQVLESEWGAPSNLAGTSVGAIIAAAYAAGHPVAELEAWALGLRRQDLLVLRLRELWKRGLAMGSLCEAKPLEALIARSIPADLKMKDVGIPLAIVTTSLRTGQPVLFSSETTPEVSVRWAALASASIPGIFPAVPHERDLLIDGMISEPIPLQRLSPSLRRVGVSLSGHPEDEIHEKMGALAAGMRAMNMMAARLSEEQANLTPDAVMLCPEVAHLPALSFRHHAAFLEAGRIAARAGVEQMRGRWPELGMQKATSWVPNRPLADTPPAPVAVSATLEFS